MLRIPVLGLLLLSLLLINPPYGAEPVRAAGSRKFALVIGVGQGYQHLAFKTLQYPETRSRWRRRCRSWASTWPR